jgi:hypothetical protein
LDFILDTWNKINEEYDNKKVEDKNNSSGLKLDGSLNSHYLKAVVKTKSPRDFSSFEEFIQYLKDLKIEGAYQVDFKKLGFKSRGEYVDSLFLPRSEFSSDKDYYDYCLIFGIKLFNDTTDVDKSIIVMNKMIDGLGGEVEIVVYAKTGALVEKGYFDENSQHYFGGQSEDKYRCYIDFDGEEVPYVTKYQPAPDDFDTYDDYVEYCNKNNLKVEFPDGNGKYGKSNGKKTYVLKRNLPKANALSVQYGMRTQFVVLDKAGYLESDFKINDGYLLQRDRKFNIISKTNVGKNAKILGITAKSVKVQVTNKTNAFGTGKWSIPFKMKNSKQVLDLSKKKKI